MFTWLNKQGVRSDKGFVVQSVNRFVIEYREGDKFIPLSVEPGKLSSSKFCVYIYGDELKQWGDGTPIATSRQEEILNNFKDAMAFQGIEVIVD